MSAMLPTSNLRRLASLLALLAATATAVAQTAAGLPVFLREPTDAMAPEIPAGTVLVQEPVVGPLLAGDLVLVREPSLRAALLARRVAALPRSRLESGATRC
ncbi:hypothetical protein [Roseateles chitinivorans]|uniref:hypothetical protein n=1 Tax=Roseateles chitinivorans TaxID=2917965 RepID=UPI003D67C7C4